MLLTICVKIYDLCENLKLFSVLDCVCIALKVSVLDPRIRVSPGIIQALYAHSLYVLFIVLYWDDYGVCVCVGFL